MNTAEMKVTYDGIDIAYDEAANVWRFELRGRERKAESLAKAKEAIDKPAPEGKKKFERFAAYMSRYSEKFKIVEVTSIAEERGWSGGSYVWILDDGKRTKVTSSDLYAITPENDALIAEYRQREKEIEALEKKNETVFKSVKKIDISGCE